MSPCHLHITLESLDIGNRLLNLSCQLRQRLSDNEPGSLQWREGRNNLHECSVRREEHSVRRPPASTLTPRRRPPCPSAGARALSPVPEGLGDPAPGRGLSEGSEEGRGGRRRRERPPRPGHAVPRHTLMSQQTAPLLPAAAVSQAGVSSGRGGTGDPCPGQAEVQRSTGQRFEDKCPRFWPPGGRV